MRKNILWLAILPLLFLNACGKGSKTQIITLNAVDFNYEGPLYDGPNPSQYAWRVDLKELLKEEYSEGMKIKSARLLSAEIKAEECKDCYGFEEINSLVLSFASNNKEVPMQAVALLNPVDSKNKTQKLNLSKEAEITDFLNEKDVYLILDSDLKSEIETDLNLNGKITIEVSFD